MRVMLEAIGHDTTWQGCNSFESQIFDNTFSSVTSAASPRESITATDCALDSSRCISDDNLLDRVSVLGVSRGWVKSRRHIIVELRVDVPHRLDLLLERDHDLVVVG